MSAVIENPQNSNWIRYSVVDVAVAGYRVLPSARNGNEEQRSEICIVSSISREQENRVNGFVEMFSSYVDDGSFKRVRFSLLAH